MAAQRAAFAQALNWLYGELVAQRAEEPVAFLAQLGRDHRKYGVLARALRDAGAGAVCDACATSCAERWTDAVDAAARAVAEPDHRGDERRRRRRDRGRPGGTARWSNTPGLPRPGRRPAATGPPDALPRRPVRQRRSAAVPAALALSDAGRSRRTTAAPSSSTSGRSPAALVSTAIVGETQPGDRWRLSSPHGALQIDRDGGDVLMVAGSTGLAPLRSIDHGPRPLGREPARAPVLRRPLPLRALRPADACGRSPRTNPWLSVTPVSELHGDPPWAADYPDVDAAARAARAPDRHAARRRHPVRQLGRPPDPDLRRTGDGRAPPRPR